MIKGNPIVAISMWILEYVFVLPHTKRNCTRNALALTKNTETMSSRSDNNTWG